MRKIALLLPLAIAFVICFSTSSIAKVINFEGVAPGTWVGTVSGPLVTDGFEFNYIGFGDYQQIYDWSGNNVVVDCCTNNADGAETRIWRQDGEPFILNSFEYGSISGGLGIYAIHVRVYEYDSGVEHHLELHPTTSGNILTGSDLGVEDVWIQEVRINLVSSSYYGSNFYFDNLNVTGGYSAAFDAGHQAGYDEGYDAGYQAGYDEGYADGHLEGLLVEEITICHKPGEANETITISHSALPGHLNHGDTIGECN